MRKREYRACLKNAAYAIDAPAYAGTDIVHTTTRYRAARFLWIAFS